MSDDLGPVQHASKLQFTLRDVIFIAGLMLTIGGAAIELRSASTRIERLETIGSPAVGKLNAETHTQIAELRARVDALQHDVQVLEAQARKATP